MKIEDIDGLNKIQEEWGYRLKDNPGFDWSITILHGFDASGDNIKKMFWEAVPFFKDDTPSFSGTVTGTEVSESLHQCVMAINGWAKENGLR